MYPIYNWIKFFICTTRIISSSVCFINQRIHLIYQLSMNLLAYNKNTISSVDAWLLSLVAPHFFQRTRRHTIRSHHPVWILTRHHWMLSPSIAPLHTSWTAPELMLLWGTLCAKFGWNWPNGSGKEEENVKSLQQRRRTTEKLWSEKLTWAFGSGEL